MERTEPDVTKVFKALTDMKRVRILQLLQDGEICACRIEEELGITQSGLSYHMKILCDSGIVESRNDSKWTYYHISRAGSQYAMEQLQTIITPAVGSENAPCRCGN